MATPRRLLLSPGVSLREVDDHLVADKPGMRVKVRDERAISLLKRASSTRRGDPSAGESDHRLADGLGVAETVEELVNCGLLEPSDTFVSGRLGWTNDYLVSLQGRYTSDLVEGVRHRLRHASVAVVGEPWMGAQVTCALDESGVGRSALCDVEALSAGETSALGAPLDLVVDLTWPAAATVERCMDDEIAVLPAVWSEDEIVVGPVLGGRGGRCRGCGGPSASSHGWSDAAGQDRSMGAGLASAAALSYLSGLYPCEVLTMSVRYDLRTRQSASVLTRGDISCPQCGVGALKEREAPHPTAQLAWSYEQSIEIPTVRHSGVERWLAVRSQSVFRRRYFNMPPLRRMAEARGVQLPEQLLSLLDTALEADATTAQGKATGIRYRRLPTVEGIGTSSVYLLPQEQDALLRGGAYYDPYEGELIPLSWPIGGEDRSVTRFSLCITGNVTGAEVCFGRFGRKVALHDAGLLLAQLLHGGSRLGLRTAISSGWSPGLIHSVLDLVAGDEVLAVIDFDIEGADEAVPDAGTRSPSRAPGSASDVTETDSWLGPAIDRAYMAMPSALDDLNLYCWGGGEEWSVVEISNGRYAGRTRLHSGIAHGPGGGAGDSTTIVVGADLQAVVYRGGATAYSSLVQRATALVHYLSLVAGDLGVASRLMLKVPARLLERSVVGGRSRHRVLAGLVAGLPEVLPTESSSLEVSP